MADSVEQVIYTYLTTDSTFMANFANVYWQDADSIAYPYIVFCNVDEIGTVTRLKKYHHGDARIVFDLWV